MSLHYLSGLGAAKKTKVQKIQAKTAKVQAKQQLKAAKVQSRASTMQAKQANRQALIKNTPQAKLIKAVAKQSPLAAQKIKKAVVVQKQRQAFKRAGEPLKVMPETLQAEEIYELPITVEEGTEEVNEPEFTDDMDSQDYYEENYDEMGIIYPSFGAPKKAKKATANKATAKKTAPKKQLSPEKKAKRQEAIKKITSQVVNVAKATLEAKGVKFPNKQQVQAEVEAIQTETEQKPKSNFKMPLIIGGAALGLYLILKK
jgi:hypothetical protein